jgi:hypothetical protein
MRRIVIAAAMSLLVVSLASVAVADTLVMRDGSRVEGTLVSFAGRTITFRHADGSSHRYPTSQVGSLEFFSADRTNTRTARNTRPADIRRLEIPAGTELVVRTGETIDSRNAGDDRTFSAILERAVMDESGRVLVPASSSAQLVIRNVSSGGTTGSPELLLDIQSITVDGRKYLVSTTDLARDSDTGIGTNTRTAATIGGGAAVGTIIGAVAGGGKGAVIGGLIGAAGGAATQVLTKGHDVKVPTETVLKFRLDQPVTLRSEQRSTE